MNDRLSISVGEDTDIDDVDAPRRTSSFAHEYSMHLVGSILNFKYLCVRILAPMLAMPVRYRECSLAYIETLIGNISISSVQR